MSQGKIVNNHQEQETDLDSNIQTPTRSISDTPTSTSEGPPTLQIINQEKYVDDTTFQVKEETTNRLNRLKQVLEDLDNKSLQFSIKTSTPTPARPRSRSHSPRRAPGYTYSGLHIPLPTLTSQTSVRTSTPTSAQPRSRSHSPKRAPRYTHHRIRISQAALNAATTSPMSKNFPLTDSDWRNSDNEQFWKIRKTEEQRKRDEEFALKNHPYYKSPKTSPESRTRSISPIPHRLRQIWDIPELNFTYDLQTSVRQATLILQQIDLTVQNLQKQLTRMHK